MTLIGTSSFISHKEGFKNVIGKFMDLRPIQHYFQVLMIKDSYTNLQRSLGLYRGLPGNRTWSAVAPFADTFKKSWQIMGQDQYYNSKTKFSNDEKNPIVVPGVWRSLKLRFGLVDYCNPDRSQKPVSVSKRLELSLSFAEVMVYSWSILVSGICPRLVFGSHCTSMDRFLIP